MPCELELEGLSDLIDKLQEMGKVGEKVINVALEKGAEPILDHMEHTTLFNDRSGNLRKSLKISGIKKKKAVRYIWIGDVDRKCSYSWVVELGSSKLTGTHFMSTAYRERRSKSLEIIKEELKKGFIEVAKRG